MGPIVCATRGGEASRCTQERAIQLAQERGAELIFICTYNPDFAGPLNNHLRSALAEEQRWIGRALLAIAQNRAREVKLESRAVVRRGQAWECITGFLRECNASALVIGQSKIGVTSPLPNAGAVHQFADLVRQELGIEVIVVKADTFTCDDDDEEIQWPSL